MFQSLASYFYGSTNEIDDNDNQQPSKQHPKQQQQQQQHQRHRKGSKDLVASVQHLDRNVLAADRQLRLVTKPCDEHDDENETEVSDWLLVDKEESPVQTDSEDEIPIVEIKNAFVAPYRRGRHSRNHSGAGSHDGLLSLSPASLLPSSMDESWFVTPPPCFTSVGPISMETSPFENLLIEHPSMSVYHSMLRSHSDSLGAGIVGGAAGDDEEDDLILIALSAAGQASVVMGNPPQPAADAVVAVGPLHPAAERSPSHTVRVRGEGAGHPNVSHRTIKQLLAGNTQKTHCHKPLASPRKGLERGNKVREVNGKGGRQKRSDKTNSKVLSRANNNRKC